MNIDTSSFTKKVFKNGNFELYSEFLKINIIKNQLLSRNKAFKLFSFIGILSNIHFFKKPYFKSFNSLMTEIFKLHAYLKIYIYI